MEVFFCFSLKIQSTSIRGKQEVQCGDFAIHFHEEAGAPQNNKKKYHKRNGEWGRQRKKEDLKSM
jgi:hypothetical protein